MAKTRLGRGELGAIAVVLTIGLGLRLYGLGSQVYWHDEVFTSLRAVGYDGPEVVAQLSGRLVTAADLQRFQRLTIENPWADTWAALRAHPEHPPLFYLLTRAWMERLGSSIQATRGLATLFSFALLPLAVWFCQVLEGYGGPGWGVGQEPDQGPANRGPDQWGRQRPRGDRRAAGILVTLLAVSPVQLLYAQEAREYSLWACGIVLANGLLLQALGAPSRRRLAAWLGYGLAIALGLYSTLLMVLIIATHGVFLLGELGLGQRSWRSLVDWAGAGAIALVLFSPWLGVMAQGQQKLSSVTAWTQQSMPLGQLARLWGLHGSAMVVDWGLPLAHLYSFWAPAIVLTLLGLCLCSIGPRQRWFLLTLLAIPALGLMLPDLLLGGQRSSLTRYFMPLVTVGLVALALGIARGLASDRPWQRRASRALWVGLILAGLLSCFRSAGASAWWNKGFNFVLPEMAAHIDLSTPNQPIWIALGSNGLGNGIALSYLVDPQTQFYFFSPPEQLPPPTVGGAWVPYASGELMAAIAQIQGRSLQLVQAPGVHELWELPSASDN